MVHLSRLRHIHHIRYIAVSSRQLQAGHGCARDSGSKAACSDHRALTIVQGCICKAAHKIIYFEQVLLDSAPLSSRSILPTPPHHSVALTDTMLALAALAALLPALVAGQDSSAAVASAAAVSR